MERSNSTFRIFVGLSIASLVISAIFGVEGIKLLPRSGYTLQQGKVLTREKVKLTQQKERDKLTIKLTSTDTTVTALVGKDQGKSLPDVVSFYYSGDPSKEVRLFEEENPVWGILIGVVLSLACLLAAIVSLANSKHKAKRGF